MRFLALAVAGAAYFGKDAASRRRVKLLHLRPSKLVAQHRVVARAAAIIWVVMVNNHAHNFHGQDFYTI